MYEKVNPSHPDKLADRIAGALVDLAYEAEENPRIAVEVLLGHETCTIIYESSVRIDRDAIRQAVYRITDGIAWWFDISWNQQDPNLSRNQDGAIRCGDNGIFRGCPVTDEQRRLSRTMRELYETFPHDGKAVLDDDRIILCQSNATWDEIVEHPAMEVYHDYLVNPLGDWTGGPDVDTGATNRKLGSDMGDAVTGGGIHGKDLSKADVSVNIACHLLAQLHGKEVTASCAIGDEEIAFMYDGQYQDIMPYESVVEMARSYVNDIGGFEKFAEWGLI